MSRDSQFPGYANFVKASRLNSGRAITAQETDEFGVDHANLGARLAQSWLPPEETTAGIQYHHDYALPQSGSVPGEPRRLVALESAAQWIHTWYNVGPKCPEWSRGLDFALNTLEISTQDWLAGAKTSDHWRQGQWARTGANAQCSKIPFGTQSCPLPCP